MLFFVVVVVVIVRRKCHLFFSLCNLVLLLILWYDNILDDYIDSSVFMRLLFISFVHTLFEGFFSFSPSYCAVSLECMRRIKEIPKLKLWMKTKNFCFFFMTAMNVVLVGNVNRWWWWSFDSGCVKLCHNIDSFILMRIYAFVKINFDVLSSYKHNRKKSVLFFFVVLK